MKRCRTTGPGINKITIYYHVVKEFLLRDGAGAGHIPKGGFRALWVFCIRPESDSVALCVLSIHHQEIFGKFNFNCLISFRAFKLSSGLINE
jgi:hypothetical protein